MFSLWCSFVYNLTLTLVCLYDSSVWFFFSFQCFVVVYSQFGVKGEITCSVVTVHYDINIQPLVLWKNKCIWENKERTCLFWVGWRMDAGCLTQCMLWFGIFLFRYVTVPFFALILFSHMQEMCVYISVTQTFQYSAFIGPYCC